MPKKESYTSERPVENDYSFVIRYFINKADPGRIIGHFLFLNEIDNDSNAKLRVLEDLKKNKYLSVYLGGEKKGLLEYGNQSGYDDYSTILNILELDDSTNYVKSLMPYYDCIGIASSKKDYVQNYYYRRLGRETEITKTKKIAQKYIEEKFKYNLCLDSIFVEKFDVIDHNNNDSPIFISNFAFNRNSDDYRDIIGIFLIIDNNFEEDSNIAYSSLRENHDKGSIERFIDVFDIDFDGNYEIIIDVFMYELEVLKVLSKKNDKWENIHQSVAGSN